MKILHVYKDFDPPVRGGMERHIALMCRFQRQWAEVEALTCSRSPRTRVIERDGTRVTEVAEWVRIQSAPISPSFPLYMRRSKCDVMVVHAPNPTAELGWLLARPRARLVVRYHSDIVRQAAAMQIYRPFQMQFLERADIIIPTSQQYLDTSPTLAPFRSKCRVVPLGIVADEFAHPREGRVAELRARYEREFVFFSGKHRYYKGLHYLIDAATSINANVVISGDGPERRALEARARALGAKVEFTGELSQEELVDHLHACSVFVFPSVARSEAFGISILEAHACGKPVVATKLGTGVEFSNLDGETGLNVSPRDPAVLAAAVNLLLADSELRGRLGETARRRVRTSFDAESIARQELSLYESTLE